MMSILTLQAETLYLQSTKAVTCPVTLTTIPRGFKVEVFMDLTAFLSPNQQHQSTEEYTKNDMTHIDTCM